MREIVNIRQRAIGGSKRHWFILQNGSMRLDRHIRLRAINLLKSTSIRPLIAARAQEISPEIKHAGPW
jgi:hypothetical protein